MSNLRNLDALHKQAKRAVTQLEAGHKRVCAAVEALEYDDLDSLRRLAGAQWGSSEEFDNLMGDSDFVLDI